MKDSSHRNLAKLVLALIGTFLIGMAGTAKASVSLASLLVPGSSFNVGDSLVFDQFTYAATGDMPGAESLRVQMTGVSDLGISLTGGMVDTSLPGASSLELGYRVRTTDGTLLDWATLSGNLAVFGSAGFIEGVAEMDGVSLSVFDQLPQPPKSKLLDSSPLSNPAGSLDVAFTLRAEAATPSLANSGATASLINMTFGQTADNVIPEPPSAVIWLGTMLMVGVVPLTYRRWAQFVPAVSWNRRDR